MLAFLEESKACSEKTYEAVGGGTDHRFEGRAVAGAALVADGKVIHLNSYRNQEAAPRNNASNPDSPESRNT